MSIYSEKLTEMLGTYDDTIANTNKSIASIDTQIDELTEQKNALQLGAMPEIVVDANVILSAKGDYVYTYGYYGTKNLIDFNVYDIVDVTTYVSSTTFKILVTDYTGTFTEDVSVLCDCGVDGIKISTVASSNYGQDEFFDYETTVILNDSVLTSNIVNACIIAYSYGDDTDLDSLKTNFDFTYDYITKEISGAGSYGLDDMILKLTTGKELLTANVGKYTSAKTILPEYAS